MRQRRLLSHRGNWLLVLLLAVIAALAPAGGAQASDGRPEFTVMTRNLYLGTDLTNTVTATSVQDLVAAVTQDWANVVATNFPRRARALADEIQQAHPDVLGLQEVSLWRDQQTSDIVNAVGVPIGAPTPNASHVVYDFLAILRAQLAGRGLSYLPVSVSTNADVEAPRYTGTGFTDVRLTDRDVILVRAPLAARFRHPTHGHYAQQLTLPSAAGGTVQFTRGWNSVDYRTAGRPTVRIFETHLEVESPTPAGLIQQLQAAEFLGLVAASPYPVIAIGDFNSAADGSTTPTYSALTSVLTDAWATAHPGQPGVTCCQSGLLDNAQSLASVRIDLVLSKGNWSVEGVRRTGVDPFRTGPPPLWASDHFGVTARLGLLR